MNILFYVVFNIIGFFISCLFFNNTLISLFFAIPFTKKLSSQGCVKEKSKLMLSHKLTILITFGISFICTLIVVLFFRNYIIPYLFGVLISLIISSKHLGTTPNNIEDYLNAYTKYLNIDKLNAILSDKVTSDKNYSINLIMNDLDMIKHYINYPKELDENLFLNLKNPYTNEIISNKKEAIDYLKMYLDDYNEPKKSTTK